MRQALLGECYIKGKGGEQNEKEACEWFSKAAAQGYDYAKWQLEYLERE